jgi:hypothetical protein
MPEAFAGRKLTVRSLRIIETIGRYRFVKTSGILRLVRGNEDVTHRHLQLLFHQSLVSRMQLPSDGNNAEFVYFLENAAKLREVAQDKRFRSEHLDFESIRLNHAKYSDDADATGSRTGRLLFIEHELMISALHCCPAKGGSADRK